MVKTTPAPFSITREGGVATVLMPTHLVVGNHAQLRKMPAIELKDDRKVLLECAGCTSIDAAGLGTIVRFCKLMVDARREVKIANLSDDLRELFRVHKVDTIVIFA